jgi:MFS family permease
MNTWLILIAYLLHFIRHGIVFPLVPLMAQTMGAGPSTIGFTVGALSLMAVFLSVPLGGLVDRLGVKRLLLAGVFFNILNAAILLRMDTIAELFCAQMIAGLAFLLHVVASQAFISRLANSTLRDKGFGFLSFGASAGGSVGPVLGGFLVSSFDYPTAFWVVFVLSCGGLVLFGLKGTTESNPTKLPYSPFHDVRQAGTLALDGRVLIILVFTFVIIFAVNLRASFLPVLLRSEGLTEALVGLLISIFAIMSTTIRLFFGKLLDVFDRKMMITISIVAVIFGVGLIPSMFSFIGFAMVISVFGLGFGLTQPLSMVMMADLTDPKVSGLAMGLRFTAIMGASLLSPILLGFVVHAFGLRSAFYFAALVVILTAIYMLIIKPDLISIKRQ